MSIFDLDNDSDTAMMSRHDPKQIRARQFQRVRRGFDPEQVRVFLDEVATQMEQVISELRFAREEAEAASRRAAPDPYAQLGSHVAELVRGAEEHAARVRREAQEHADRQVSEASEIAEQTKREAEDHAKQVRAEADAAAERSRSEGAAESDRVMQEATAHAERTRKAAQEEAGRVREQARTVLERSMAEAEAAVAEVKSERDRMLVDIRGAREGLHVALTRLDQALASIEQRGDGDSEIVNVPERDEAAAAAVTEAPPPPLEHLIHGGEERQRVPTDLPPLPDLWEFTAQLERGRTGRSGGSGESDIHPDLEGQPADEREGAGSNDVDIQIPDIPLVDERRDGPGPT
jgi:DivIVA domain-containing protein